jgi:predicted nucleic acid-binding protein
MFNYYFDTDRDAHKDTVKLFEQIKQGNFEPYTSQYVIDELENAPEPKRTNMLNLLEKYSVNLLDATHELEAEKLMEIYVTEKMIPENYKYDGLHIAIASINDLDYILSLNFQHINKLKTKTMTDVINIREGYKKIIICSPMEVINNE